MRPVRYKRMYLAGFLLHELERYQDFVQMRISTRCFIRLP